MLCCVLCRVVCVLCVVRVGVVWCGVVCVGVVVFGVWCGTQKKPPCIDSNVSVCTGTTRTCVKTCGRGVGTHRDVLNLHTEVVWTDTRRGRRRGRGEGGVTVSSANHETAHVELSRASEKFTESNQWILTILSLRTGREQHVPDPSNHSLHLKAVQFQLS